MIQTTIITGSTGIGKSKFVINLLESLPETSNAIFISHRHANSFGLETTALYLLDNVTHHQVFDFGSGCICCSPDGDLTRLLKELSQSSPTKYTHCFLETTGVADVPPFINVIANASLFFLQGVVVLVDPNKSTSKMYAIDTDRPSYDRCVAQIKNSDLIVTVSSSTASSPSSTTITTSAKYPPLHSLTLEQLVQAAATFVSERASITATASTSTTSTPTKTIALSIAEEDQALLSHLSTLNITDIKLFNGRIDPTTKSTTDYDMESCIDWKDIVTCLKGDEEELQNNKTKTGSCESCVTETNNNKSVLSVPTPFGMSHDRTFSSVCITENGGVLWSKCKLWLENLLSSHNGDMKCARIKGWITTVQENNYIYQDDDQEEDLFDADDYQAEEEIRIKKFDRKNYLKQRQLIKHIYFIDGTEGNLKHWKYDINDPINQTSMEEEKYETSQSTALSTYLATTATHANQKHFFSSKLFFFGQQLKRNVIEDQFRKLTIYNGYVSVADVSTEFGNDIGLKYVTGCSPIKKSTSKKETETTKNNPTIPGLTFTPISVEAPSVQILLAEYYQELNIRIEGGFDHNNSTHGDVASTAPPNGIFLLVEMDKVPVGIGAIKTESSTSLQKIGELKRMYLKPSVRSQGIGQLLVKELLNWGRKLGMESIRLDSNRALSNAIGMYRSCGFVDIPRYNWHPYGDVWLGYDLTNVEEEEEEEEDDEEEELLTNIDHVTDLDTIENVIEWKRIDFEVRTVALPTASTNISSSNGHVVMLALTLHVDNQKGDQDVVSTIPSIPKNPLHLRCHTADTWMNIPLTTVGTTIYVNLLQIERIELALHEMIDWYLSGVRITRLEVKALLQLDSGSISIQTSIVNRILKHVVAIQYPVDVAQQERLITDVIKVMWETWPRKALHDGLLELHQEFSIGSVSEHSRGGEWQPPNTAPSSLMETETPPLKDEVLEGSYYRSFMIPEIKQNTIKTTTTSNKTNQNYVSVRCRDSFGGTSGTSIKVWPSGVILGRYLAMHCNQFTGMNVAEFGCGTGVTGIMLLAAAANNAADQHGPLRYLFTDGAQLAVANARFNIAAMRKTIPVPTSGGAGATVISFDVLDWVAMRKYLRNSENVIGEMYQNVDVLIGADLFYDPSVANCFVSEILVPFLINHPVSMSNGKKRRCLCATSIRNEASWNKVLALFRKNKLQWVVVDMFRCPFGTSSRVEVGSISPS